ncbi:hypothetical protein CJF32_00003570 [Rutstroemia sp. NJR-2017a WRK4]|nr:hypothetical protein CJF32_00003570 [Rutstroemia sp. NJR-2017a WRK4]
MVQYVITPWRTRHELLRVRSALYPADRSLPRNLPQQRNAVALVAVWMQRGNCPHLVEASAIITAAILNDVPGNETWCVRAAYSAAFCRFVTGLLDSHQDKRRKSSMYNIAKTLGLPATYVELRHQATHEELPSLAKLRIAARKALKWIWEFYWRDLGVGEEEEEVVGKGVELMGKGVGDVLGKGERMEVEEQRETDVRRFVRSVLVEGKEEDLSIERLKEFDLAELMREVQEVGEGDVNAGVMMRYLKMMDKIYDLEEDLKSTKCASQPATPMKDLDGFRAEMRELDRELGVEEGEGEADEEGDNEVDADSPMDEDETPSVESKQKGWTRWEGPWIPKPIGVV